MARNLFSVPIFFIVFRETLEASIIVAVLLGLVEQIVHDDPGRLTGTTNVGTTAGQNTEKEREGSESDKKEPVTPAGETVPNLPADEESAEAIREADAHINRRRLVRKLRIQVNTNSHSASAC